MQHGIGGRRTAVMDARWGFVDIVDVAPELATPIGEMAIRSAAARVSRLGAPLAPVHTVERDHGGLHVIGPAVEGRRISDLLVELEARDIVASDAALLELAAMTVTAVGWLHELPGKVCHGALAPAHIVLRPNGQLLLTDAVFGEAITRVRLNRERLWRDLSVATPACAGEPVLDQRSDITSLGAVVLALMLRRPIHADEYPHRAADLIMTATTPLPEWRVLLRSWLQQTLHVLPGFTSSAAAIEAFTRVTSGATNRRDGARALFAVVFPPVAAS